MNDRTMRNKVTARLLAATKGNDTEIPKKTPSAIRVSSWIVVSVKRCSRLELADLCHSGFLFPAGIKWQI